MKEKLVPWMQSSPQPTGPMRRHWMKVEIPEAISAVETSVLVVSMSACRAPAMMSGGVMMATKWQADAARRQKGLREEVAGRQVRKSNCFWGVASGIEVAFGVVAVEFFVLPI